VCLFHKSLYGLKQAPQTWFQKLSDSLVQLGFKSSSYDPSLFLSHSHDHVTLVLVYVNDIIVTGNNTDSVHDCIDQLSSQFAICDLDNLHYFLEIKVHPTDASLRLTQTKYLCDLLKRTNMLNCKPCLTPMASDTSLSQYSSPCEDLNLYRSVVGALQYATLTRPEISFSVNKISQFMHLPTETLVSC
jgi:Reverse transcriptase (RNA-dependent DNA polymerase)